MAETQKERSMKLAFQFFAMTAIAIGHDAMALDCFNPQSSEDIATCLGDELRATDARINESYQSAMKELNGVQQQTLRTEQRSWLKERNAVCKLDTKEPDRERWYRALLTDYSKTVCVTRYTRVRAAELEQVAAANAKPNTVAEAAPQSRPELFPKDPHAYWMASTHAWSKGRWYWEVKVKTEDIANFYPTTLSIGCSRAEGGGAGLLVSIRPGNASTDKGDVVYGIALDLDDGKIYSRQNGTWTSGEPGSIKGMDVKLGRMYTCGVNSTIAISPLQKRNYLIANFGDRPFAYSLPDGYRPFAAP
jgi:uncharacterized protein YecT (DUF1311 family)